jgi:hypothetical protein
MGYARADSRPRLRCCTSRGRTHLAIIILAIYGVTIAFGLSHKSGIFSSNLSRDRRHGSDTEPSDLTVPPAPPPHVRIAVAVPIVDSTCYGPFRPEHERSASQGCICAIQPSGWGRTGKVMEMAAMAHNRWRAVAPPCLAGHASRFDSRRAIPVARRSAFANSFRDVDGKARRRTRRWPETSLQEWPTRPHHQRCSPDVGRNGRPGG